MRREKRIRRTVLGLLSGSLWGGLAGLIGHRAMGPPVTYGVWASPVIGALVALAFGNWPRFSLAWRVGLALASLYFGAALFGLAVGAADALRVLSGPHAMRAPFAVVAQDVYGTLWGLTLLGWFVPLWPLAYLNHAVIARLTEE